MVDKPCDCYLFFLLPLSMSFIALFSSLYLLARSGAVLHRPHNQSVFTFLMGMNALVIVNNLGDKRNRRKHAAASHRQPAEADG